LIIGGEAVPHVLVSKTIEDGPSWKFSSRCHSSIMENVTNDHEKRWSLESLKPFFIETRSALGWV
jgi:hypothetical protein